MKKTTSTFGLLFSMFYTMLNGVVFAEIDLSYESKIEHCKSLKNKHVEAITFANSILETIDKSKHPLSYIKFKACLGWALVNNNQIEQSKNIAAELEAYAIEIDISEDKAILLRVSGSIFHQLGDRISASINYEQAFLIAQQLDLTSQKIPLLANLGVLNSQLQQYPRAIENFYTALDLMKEIDDDKYKPVLTINLAITLNGQKRYKEAKIIFQEIEQTIDDSWSDARLHQLYSSLASLYLNLDEHKKAKLYISKAFQLINKTDTSAVTTAENLVLQALISEDLLEHDLALKYANDAYSLYLNFEKKEGIKYFSERLSYLALIFEKYGQYEKALTALKMHELAKKNFQDDFNKQSMIQLQARLDNIQQREELTNLKHKNAIKQLKLNQLNEEKLREIIIGIGIFSVLIIFMVLQKIMNNNLKKTTLLDSLTNLGNRRATHDWLKKHSLPPENNRIIWLIDLDYFKKVNDTYGHDVGDMVLVQISSFLSTLENEHRLISRWGGEEFMLITDDIHIKDIAVFAEKILKTISNLHVDFNKQKIQITASMGACQILDGSKHAWNKYLTKTDKALYQAKNNGRNKFVFL